MAIKGQSYTKTTWTFEERPVGSSKLNLWDDRIEAALETIQLLLNQAWGGGSGVIRGATAEDLAVMATGTPGLSVDVMPGIAFIGKYFYRLVSETETVDVSVPTSQDRIDSVQARLATWDVSIKTGVESASPVAPEPDEDCIALAQLHLRPGMSTIEDTDDTTNGYVVDARTFL